MFTGIVETIGCVTACDAARGRHRIAIDAGWDDVAVGESIAVNGCCLTAASTDPPRFWVDLSQETLECSTLGCLAPNVRVNLERAVQIGSRLGGHFVTGHVDLKSLVIDRQPINDCWRYTIALPKNIAAYVIPKGSIAIDGISLTINRVMADRFELMIVPATQRATVLLDRMVGDEVNLEADLLAKHVAQYVRSLHGVGIE